MIYNINKPGHDKFCSNVQHTIDRFDHVNVPFEEITVQKLAILEKNNKELKKLYNSYNKKAAEIRKIINDYEKIRHDSRINLRKVQTWLKFTYPKLSSFYLKSRTKI